MDQYLAACEACEGELEGLRAAGAQQHADLKRRRVQGAWGDCWVLVGTGRRRACCCRRAARASSLASQTAGAALPPPLAAPPGWRARWLRWRLTWTACAPPPGWQQTGWTTATACWVGGWACGWAVQWRASRGYARA